MAESILQRSLLSLPPELHLSIISYLSWWDTYALRLTCHRFHALLVLPLKQHTITYGDKFNQDFRTSFFIRNNDLNICNGCMIVCHASECHEWTEDESRREVKRKDIPVYHWMLCKSCDQNQQLRRATNWCCGDGRSPYPCSHCNEDMLRVSQ